MRDLAAVAALVFAFAVLLTAHVTIVLGLWACRPRWHAPVALVALPLAPYWALKERMTVRATLWVIALATYIVARIT